MAVLFLDIISVLTHNWKHILRTILARYKFWVSGFEFVIIMLFYLPNS